MPHATQHTLRVQLFCLKIWACLLLPLVLVCGNVNIAAAFALGLPSLAVLISFSARSHLPPPPLRLSIAPLFDLSPPRLLLYCLCWHNQLVAAFEYFLHSCFRILTSVQAARLLALSLAWDFLCHLHINWILWRDFAHPNSLPLMALLRGVAGTFHGQCCCSTTHRFLLLSISPFCWKFSICLAAFLPNCCLICSFVKLI